MGAREQYAVPRIFEAHGILNSVITEFWAPAYVRWLARINSARHFGDRFHRDLQNADVKAFNLRFLAERACRRRSKWASTYQLNRVFAQQAARRLAKTLRTHSVDGVFAYSYAALEIFQEAKRHRLKTVLGQIDAGPYAEKIYDRAYCQVIGAPLDGFQKASKEYWDSWRRECELADMIVVNSLWSKDALEKDGISPHKIQVIPIAFESRDLGFPAKSTKVEPRIFSPNEPLKVAFVGNVSIQKGIHHLLEAAYDLKDEPVQFQIIGRDNNLEFPIATSSNVTNIGPVPRREIRTLLEQSDLLLFPTLSDGFGIVQLEAHAAGLPVIASKCCGDVVIDGQSGVILRNLDSSSISASIRLFIRRPELLMGMSVNAVKRVQDFNMDRVGKAWIQALARIH